MLFMRTYILQPYVLDYHVYSAICLVIGVIIVIVVSMPMIMILMPIIIIDQSCDDICAVVMVTSSGRSDHKAPP